MILVTGGAGFIGSQIVQGLNAQGISDIIIVDNLTNGRKFINLRGLSYADYFDKSEFMTLLEQNPQLFSFKAIFHQGACSATTQWDGQYMMRNNFTYSKTLLNIAIQQQCPFIYASSAAVYGSSTQFKESPEFELPINVYGYSKLYFDQYVRRLFNSKTTLPQIVGLRYFNVYGPGESHKGAMSSVALHFNNQIKASGQCKLFQGTHGYKDGEQLRDFVAVTDIVQLNLWLLKNPQVSGIFNAGTGRSQSFNDVADAVISWHKFGEKSYIPFPDHLRDAYQAFTQADLTQLRNAGYTAQFSTVSQGVAHYLQTINTQ